MACAAALLAGCGASLNADVQSSGQIGGLTSVERTAGVPAATVSTVPLTAAPSTATNQKADVPADTVKMTPAMTSPPATFGVSKTASATAARSIDAPGLKPATAVGTSGTSVAKAAEALTLVANPSSTAYKIGPQDILDISVFKAPELSKSVQVADNGMINLPLLDDVQASGKTAQEVERDLATKLGSKYLQKPQVTVFVKEYNSQRVTLEGAVKKPGVYPIRGRMTLLQLAATSEGLTDISDSTMVIFRVTGGTRTAAKFDIADIRSGSTPDPLVQSGDVIIAPTSAFKEAYGVVLKALPLAAFAAL